MKLLLHTARLTLIPLSCLKNTNNSVLKAIFLHSLIIVMLFFVGMSDAAAQRKPSLGFSLGAATLSGNSGFMFDSSLEPPHRDLGVSAGLTAFIPLEMDLHLTVGAMATYERAHFHTDLGNARDIVTGYFHYGYLQVPVLLNHSAMHRSKQFFVLKEFFGFGFNLGNALDAPFEKNFDNLRFGYKTLVTPRWEINPEFIIGMGLISRQLKVGRIHYSVSLHMDVARNQQFQAWVIDHEANQQIYAERTIRGIKGQFTMTYYPHFKPKKQSCYRIGR